MTARGLLVGLALGALGWALTFAVAWVVVVVVPWAVTR